MLNIFEIFAFSAIAINVMFDFLFVLILNPRKSVKKIKSAILDDREFVSAMVKEITSVDPSLYDGIMERFRQKLMGTLQGYENAMSDANPMELKALKKDLARDVIDQNPAIMTVLNAFPQVKKRIEANPALINVLIEMLEKGFPTIKEYLIEQGILTP